MRSGDPLLHGVPARFQDRSQASYVPATARQSAALDAVRQVLDGRLRTLVLVGPTGIGKTHLAAAVANEVRDRGRTAYAAACIASTDIWPTVPDDPTWINVPDFIVSLRLEFDASPQDRPWTALAQAIRRDRGVLVLDDLGREKVSDWTGELVYAVINARYEARLATIVTSNLGPAELARSPYWPAISRLAEDGALLRLDGPDRRVAASTGRAGSLEERPQ